jgi:glutamyl-tRNA reductase
MPKRHVTISIDESVHEQVKQTSSNVSGLVEALLRGWLAWQNTGKIEPLKSELEQFQKESIEAAVKRAAEKLSEGSLVVVKKTVELLAPLAVKEGGV